jgi:hypothetical protein
MMDNVNKNKTIITMGGRDEIFISVSNETVVFWAVTQCRLRACEYPQRYFYGGWKFCASADCGCDCGYYVKTVILSAVPYCLVSRDSYSLRAGQSGDGISSGTRFPHPCRQALRRIGLFYNGYRVSIMGVKPPVRGAYRPPPGSAEVKGREYPCSPSGPSWPATGWTLPLF